MHFTMHTQSNIRCTLGKSRCTKKTVTASTASWKLPGSNCNCDYKCDLDLFLGVWEDESMIIIIIFSIRWSQPSTPSLVDMYVGGQACISFGHKSLQLLKLVSITTAQFRTLISISTGEFLLTLKFLYYLLFPQKCA